MMDDADHFLNSDATICCTSLTLVPSHFWLLHSGLSVRSLCIKIMIAKLLPRKEQADEVIRVFRTEPFDDPGGNLSPLPV
jgi:hypothetical protein